MIRYVAAAGLLLAGCTDRPREPSELIRLASRLAEAEIASPLTDHPAVDSVAELDGVALEELWREDFESPPLRFAAAEGCIRSPGKAGRGFVLVCEDDARARVRIPVQPNTGYRVHFRGRRRGRPEHAVMVTEWSADDRLRVFHFPQLTTRWKPHEIFLFSSPECDHIEIAVNPRQLAGRVLIDDLTVERLDLTRQQKLSLLKSRHNLPAPEPYAGMVKRGRLLPLVDAQTVTAPLDDNYTIRDAIFAPTPTDVHFRLRVPRDGRLRLAYALSEASTAGDAAVFRVLASEDGGEPRVLLEDSFSLGEEAAPWPWREKEIPLAEWAGREIRLTLATRSLAGDELLYALWGQPEIYSPRRAGDPPNVVLIAVDTLRADRLSCYGHTPGVSPAIDSLAVDGVLFDQAASSTNWTTPSFLALFTGLDTLDLQANLYHRPQATLAEHFRAAGWSTAGIAYKIALYRRGFDRGFDSFFNIPRFYIRAEENLAKALDWLSENRDRRFFLFLHFDDPHQPFCQPAEGVDGDIRRRLERHGMTLPISVESRAASSIDPQRPLRTELAEPCESCMIEDSLTPAFKELARDIYDDAVSYADEAIGRFLSALREEGLYDDAVIAFMSDHGEALWAHHDQYGHTGSNLHDELIRVPLIVKPPLGKRWARGATVSSQVRLIDLMPTLLELAGLDAGRLDTAAESLLPALLAEPDGELGHRPAFSVSDDHDEVLSLRYGGWKYIRFFPGGKKERPRMREKLYDLGADPGETADVLEAEPEVAARMRLAMDELLLAEGPGRIVLVKADPSRDHRIRLRWDRRAKLERFAYPRLDRVDTAEGVVWETSGRTRSAVALLAAFETPAAARLEVTVSAAGGPRLRHVGMVGPDQVSVYRRGRLEEILSEPGVGVYVFAGRRSKRSESLSGSEPIDVRQEQVLKALGYVQ